MRAALIITVACMVLAGSAAGVWIYRGGSPSALPFGPAAIELDCKKADDPDPRASIEDGSVVVLAGWLTSVADDPDPILGQLLKQKPPDNPGRITVIEGRQPSHIQIPGLNRVESLEVICRIAKGSADGAGLEGKRVLVRGIWQKAGFMLQEATVLGAAP